MEQKCGSSFCPNWGRETALNSETPDGDPKSVHITSWLCQLSSNVYKSQEAFEKTMKAGDPSVVACACPPLLQESRLLLTMTFASILTLLYHHFLPLNTGT